MKKFKTVFTLALTTAFAVTSTVSVFATSSETSIDNLSISSELSSSFNDLIASSIMVNDTISQIENEYDVTLDIKPSDIASNPVDVDEQWVDDANDFLDNYIASNSRSRNARIASQPNSEQTAKASAIMYSADRAAFSLQRNPTLDFSKEVQYMFLSHYIDRYDYYWSSKDERLLLDGATMSGENGYLADWLTPSDRRSYQMYMEYTGFNTSLQQVGNVALAALEYRGTPQEVVKYANSLKKANDIYSIGYGMVLQDTAKNVGEVWNDDLLPLYDKIVLALRQDSAEQLSALYDRYMNDEGFLNTYSEEDKGAVVLTAVSMVGATIVGGLGGLASAALSTVAYSALGITLETFTNYFNYAAYVSLRYGFSGRYANRTSYYLSTIM